MVQAGNSLVGIQYLTVESGDPNYTHQRLAYKNPGNSSPPDSANMAGAAQNLLSTGSYYNDSASDPEVVQKPGGYRLYYSYNNGSYWQLAYKDADSRLPGLYTDGFSTAAWWTGYDSGRFPSLALNSSGAPRIMSQSWLSHIEVCYRSWRDDYFPHYHECNANCANSANWSAAMLLNSTYRGGGGGSECGSSAQADLWNTTVSSNSFSQPRAVYRTYPISTYGTDGLWYAYGYWAYVDLPVGSATGNMGWSSFALDFRDKKHIAYFDFSGGLYYISSDPP